MTIHWVREARATDPRKLDVHAGSDHDDPEIYPDDPESWANYD